MRAGLPGARRRRLGATKTSAAGGKPSGRSAVATAPSPLSAGRVSAGRVSAGRGRCDRGSTGRRDCRGRGSTGRRDRRYHAARPSRPCCHGRNGPHRSPGGSSRCGRAGCRRASRPPAHASRRSTDARAAAGRDGRRGDPGQQGVNSATRGGLDVRRGHRRVQHEVVRAAVRGQLQEHRPHCTMELQALVLEPVPRAAAASQPNLGINVEHDGEIGEQATGRPGRKAPHLAVGQRAACALVCQR